MTSLPPGPTLTAPEQTLRWLTRPYDFLRDCATAHGPTFTLDLGAHGAYVLLSNPDDVRAIFTASSATLHAGKGNAILEPLLGKRSLLLLEEARHLRDRRLLLPAFHAKHIARFARLVSTVSRDAVESSAADESVVIHDVLARISLGVVTSVVFGERGGVEAEELRQTMGAFLDDPRFNLSLIGRLRDENSNHPAFQAFQKLLARVHELLRAEIELRRASSATSEDILELLLAARDEQGRGLDDDEILDELLTMVVTGHETTSTAMAWALSWLARSPVVLDRLRAELAAAPAGDPLAIARLPYLDAVCRETLRIRPVIPVVARQVMSRIEIGGRTYEPGVTLAPCVYLAHHRPEAFPNPDKFSPERFLEHEPTPYEYFPFGGGGRRCLGMSLAICEMKVAIASLLDAWELGSTSETISPVRRSVTIAPRDDGSVRTRRRTPAERGRETSEERP